MSLLRVVVVVGIAASGYAAWKHYEGAGARAQEAAESAPSPNGFESVPLDGDRNSVVIFAPLNCSREEAQRADFLADTLSRRGIPVKRTQEANISFSGIPDDATASRVKGVMNGPLPIVFVKGRAKSNPTIEETVAEYKR
jgi:hypothetical protein